MTYEKAMAKAYEKLKEADPNFDGITISERQTPAEIAERACIFAWNAIAIAQAEKGLDDLVVIDNNNNIKSIPLKALKTPEPPKSDSGKSTKVAKSRGKKTATAKKSVDVKEPQEKSSDNKQ